MKPSMDVISKVISKGIFITDNKKPTGDTGTSEGAKKGWLTRERGGGVTQTPTSAPVNQTVKNGAWRSEASEGFSPISENQLHQHMLSRLLTDREDYEKFGESISVAGVRDSGNYKILEANVNASKDDGISSIVKQHGREAAIKTMMNAGATSMGEQMGVTREEAEKYVDDVIAGKPLLRKQFYVFRKTPNGFVEHNRASSVNELKPILNEAKAKEPYQ